jgi:hypothetical protein
MCNSGHYCGCLDQVATEYVTVVILTGFFDLAMAWKVAMVALFPNVASVGIEKRVVIPAI